MNGPGNVDIVSLVLVLRIRIIHIIYGCNCCEIPWFYGDLGFGNIPDNRGLINLIWAKSELLILYCITPKDIVVLNILLHNGAVCRYIILYHENVKTG